MNYQVKISEKISWIGANDRRKHLFENMWPLPQGVAYNSYLITDEKTALLDTIDTSVAADYLDQVSEQLQGRSLDYLIINHMEPDHAGMIGSLVKRFPKIQIVGNAKTFKMLESYFGISENLLEVKDGDTLDLGYHKLKFVFTPWVHWPETMITYDTTEQIIFSADAFGSFGTLDGGIFDDEVNTDYYVDETRRYFSNIVGQYSNMVQKALAKLKGVPVRIICPTHGLIWRSNPSKIIDMYDRWSKYESQAGVVIAFASMYGNTEKMADYIARRLAEQGIREVRVFDVSKTHISFLISEIWKYSGLILGSCAYNSNAHPMMEQLCRELLHIKPQNKHIGVFGSGSWNGGGVRSISKTLEELGWSQVSDAVEIFGNPTHDKVADCNKLAAAMAKSIQTI